MLVVNQNWTKHKFNFSPFNYCLQSNLVIRIIVLSLNVVFSELRHGVYINEKVFGGNCLRLFGESGGALLVLAGVEVKLDKFENVETF